MLHLKGIKMNSYKVTVHAPYPEKRQADSPERSNYVYYCVTGESYQEAASKVKLVIDKSGLPENEIRYVQVEFDKEILA
jgi:hypothetical protein